MADPIDRTKQALEEAKRIGPRGGEYWMGRELQEILGYTKWDNFESVIEKAKKACLLSGEEIKNHFLDTRKVISAGKGAQLERGDYYVDRYASYLIAMNGDSAKPEIASAQTYFAVKTRLQEIGEEHARIQKRSDQRNRITSAVKGLNSAAKEAGVQNYALFHGAGYRGLYSMGLKDVKTQKGIAQDEDLYDRIGPTELAAHEFRLTQARDKIERERITGQANLEVAHHEVGKEVRTAIAKIGGTMPEKLPAEPSLKKKLKEQKANAKLAKKAVPSKLDDTNP